MPVSAGTPPTPGLPPPQPARSTLADWAATEEDEYLWAAAAEKRQRGGRKAAKKRKKLAAENQRETDWDEIYDPARPTNVDEYLRSDERIREVQEWKAVLYAHRRKARRDSYEESDESDEDGEKLGVGSKSGLRGFPTVWPYFLHMLLTMECHCTKTNSPLQQISPSHHRQCLRHRHPRPETHPRPPHLSPLTQQATTSTPGALRCLAWHRWQQRCRHRHLPMSPHHHRRSTTVRPSPADPSATKHHHSQPPWTSTRTTSTM